MRFAAILSCTLVVAACRTQLSDEKLVELSVQAEKLGPPLLRAGHQGPGVSTGVNGTGRFAHKFIVAFATERALAMTAFADRWYREPGNEGFESVIDEVKRKLEDVGFGRSDELLIEIIETPMNHDAWTPKRARLSMSAPGAGERVLHAFEKSDDRDRTMLPVYAPSASVEGRVVTAVDAIEAGCVLLTDRGLRRQLLEDAKSRGAVLVMSSDLAEYNVDPGKGERHLDAIGYRHAPRAPILPVAQISPRSARALREALEKSPDVRVRFECEVKLEKRPLRTLVATVVGAKTPDECVVIAAHVQEPGACDNASGVGMLLECARTVTKLRETGELGRPARSVCFVWGNENEQSRIFLEKSKYKTFVGLAADMTGESLEKTGAKPLLERFPDPGAVKAYAPDEHTAWAGGRGATWKAEKLEPNGLNVVARCALVDTGLLCREWLSSEHPFEGGSDHVEYIEKGIPAVLFWHFPDFAYHTSLDRMEHVDADEMRRMGSALMATAFALADPRPVDLDRYLKSLKLEVDGRVAVCTEAGDEATAKLWRDWSTGARMWLRALCLPGASGEGAREPDENKEKQ
jgi:hypothetical protein